jgi:hypothetical protein
MSRLLVIALALVAAVHVSLGNIPAPVPVIVVLALVIGGLCLLIIEATFRTVHVSYRRAGP